jgi:hypothetical protein
VDDRVKAFNPFSFVMPGLEPGIHALESPNSDVDGRDKPGHDERMGTMGHRLSRPLALPNFLPNERAY